MDKRVIVALDLTGRPYVIDEVIYESYEECHQAYMKRSDHNDKTIFIATILY